MQIDCVRESGRAGVLLHPLRRRILERARIGPVSASQVAADLDLPRQRVNYHVRELAKAGFLRRAGSRRKGNMTEKLYEVEARGWVLDPAVLGSLGVDPDRLADTAGAAHLIALAARSQSEVARAAAEAEERGKRLATLSLDAELRFESARQRKEFTEALEQAVAQVVARHSSPARREDGKAGRGRPYRLILGCHPIPPEEGAPEHASKEGDGS